MDGAEGWFQEMELNGFAARGAIFAPLIELSAKSCSVARAEVWVERALAAQAKLGAVPCCAVIGACSKAGDPARAEQWHVRFEAAGMKPSAHSVSAVISGYA